MDSPTPTLDTYRHKCERLETEVANLKKDLSEAVKRAQRAEDKLEFFIQAHKEQYMDLLIVDISDAEDDAGKDAHKGQVVDDGKPIPRVVANATVDDDDDDVVVVGSGQSGRGYLPMSPMPRRNRASRVVLSSDSEDNRQRVPVRSDGRLPESWILKAKQRVVTSDSEDDDDDRIAVSMVRLDERNAGEEEEDSGSGEKQMPKTSMLKRKQRVVSSDSEEDDDMIPISMLRSNARNLDEMRNGNTGSGEKHSRKSSMLKRKRAHRVVTTDSEDEDEDNIPLSRLKAKSLGKAGESSLGRNQTEEDVIAQRRRLVPLRETDGGKGGTRGTSAREDNSPFGGDKRGSRSRISARRSIVFSDGEDELASGSESESLDGFIVDDSGDSESNSGSAAACEEGENSDSDADMDTVLAMIRRGKDLNKWEYEADMLSAFANNDELCMKAVCDLWRLQTDDEKDIKHVILHNNQGFSRLDAHRGSLMAEFLTDGDRDGPVKKTVQELTKFDPEGVEYCRKLAFHYSGQLFSLYQNNEDCSTLF